MTKVPREPDQLKFLLADDHAVVRRGLRELLAEEFPRAIFGEAGTAQETLEQCWQEPWDLIVLDITMPGRTGLEILQDLRTAQPKTPILVQSMHAEDHFAMRVLKNGAAGYITKETLPAELLLAVHKVLAGGRYVSQSLAEKLASFFATDTNRPIHEILSDREFQVLRMIAEGRATKEIAAELSLSIKTISTYRARLLQKLNVRSNSELVQYAMREGLIE
ncbi:MAG: response regulator transcription factor [Spartobacteria bacterium]